MMNTFFLPFYLLCNYVILDIVLFLIVFIGPHLQHIDVPRLGVKTELQLPAYATAMQDLSCICSLHHSSWQHQILNPLIEARDQTCILMDASWVH